MSDLLARRLTDGSAQLERSCRQPQLRAIAKAWPRVVGPLLAPLCGIVAVTGGVLTVAVHHVYWDDALRVMAPRIIDRLSAAGFMVCWIRFVDGGLAWVEA